MGLEGSGTLRKKVSRDSFKQNRKDGGEDEMSKGWSAALVLMGLAVTCGYAQAQSLRVNVGIANSATDAALFVADKKGHFKAEGLEVNFIAFDSGARMIAPFASGDLDVGAGGPSAGLYNAVARGIDIRIVADKSSTPPGRPINFLLVRKDHVESGRYKTLADLKGMKVAGAAPGGAATTTLDKLLEMAGLRIADVERVYLGFPQQAIALENKAVDAALPTEPAASEAVKRGSAVRVIGDDEIYPNHQLAAIFYAGQFIKNKPDAAKRFMRAYIKGARDYADAIVDGRLSGAKGEEMIAILTASSQIKDPEIYRSIAAANIDPDGKLGIESLKADLAIFAKEGLIEGKVDIDKVIDTSFAEAVVKELGPYKRGDK
jgi:NitT/TauT family transport system substrate-binding protein